METVNLKGQLRLGNHDKAFSLVIFVFLFPYRVTFYRETVENMPEDSWDTGVSLNISQRSRGQLNPPKITSSFYWGCFIFCIETKTRVSLIISQQEYYYHQPFNIETSVY